MKKKRPIIALTGPSGAGKTNIKSIFDAIFQENQIKIKRNQNIQNQI